MTSQIYTGRFAPSPSGPLHMGSLVTALGSYLQAHANHGSWRLRIDDIDPPRIVPGAIEEIQDTLQCHGLTWDGTVVYQSNNSDQYETVLQSLLLQQKVFPCDCTRAQIKASGGIYKGVCRNKQQVASPFSLRFKHDRPIHTLQDEYLGTIAIDTDQTHEDFIVKRKDGLYAYHLASVVDDIAMGITEIVRGEDLLLPTACQWALFNALGAIPPKSMHLPLVTFADGRKYSKQNKAPALDKSRPSQNLQCALRYLGIQVTAEANEFDVEHLLEWSVKQWQRKPLPVSS